MKTYVMRKEDVKRKWWLVDCNGKVLGRVASEIVIWGRSLFFCFF